MRKVNKVKFPKWSTCDYVHHPSPPLPPPIRKCKTSPLSSSYPPTPPPSPPPPSSPPPTPPPSPPPPSSPPPSPPSSPPPPPSPPPPTPTSPPTSPPSPCPRVVLNLNSLFNIIVYIWNVLMNFSLNILNFFLYVCHFNIFIFFYLIFSTIYITFYFIYKFLKHRNIFPLFIFFVHIFIIYSNNSTLLYNSKINLKDHDYVIKHNLTNNANKSTNLNNYNNFLFKNIIFINDANSNRYYNNLSVFYKKKVKPISIFTNLSPQTSNRNRIGFFCVILCTIFSFKTKRNPIFNLFYFGMLFFLFNNISLHKSHRHKELNSCTNLEFFTIESINICNNINKYHLKNNLNLLTFSKVKYKKNSFLFQHLLLLSGDISLNPGPNQEYQLNNETWSPFKKRGLHFLHININSLLPKIDELRSIAEKSKAAVIGISETKLDKSVLNSEIDIVNYVIIQRDRNRNGGGVACYIRSDICFNELNIFSNQVENICFNILLKNLQPITIGVFYRSVYRPPSQNRFLEEISNDFNKLYTEKNEVIILGDLNINLLQNGKYTLNKNNLSSSEKVTTHPLLKQYKQFISNFGLTQLIMNPTRVTCEASTLIDHILVNSDEKISQYGVIDIGISDHQMIYCTRKLFRNKTGVEKYIKSRSLKNYSVDVYESALKDLDFPNYETFTDIDLAYSDFIQKLTDVIDNIAPLEI